MKPKKIDVGCEAIDSISGFRGTVVAVISYLYGGGRVGIQPNGLHEGKPIETQWFPYEQCTHADDCCLTPGEWARREWLAERNAIIKFIEHDCNANADTDIGECLRALIESISHGYHEKYLAKKEK